MLARNSTRRRHSPKYFLLVNFSATFELWKNEPTSDAGRLEEMKPGGNSPKKQRINENDKHEKFIFMTILLLSHCCEENESVLLLI